MNYFDRKIKVDMFLFGTDLGVSFSFLSSDLDIFFDITKTNGGESNKGELHIYNLSPDKVALIKKSGAGSVTISVGYGNFQQVSTLFTGDIGQVKTERQGGDILTIITIATSLVVKRALASSKSWGAGVTLAEVINYLSISAGLKLEFPLKIKSHVWKRGVTISGNVAESIDKILTDTGHSYTIDDNVLKIWMKDSNVATEVLLLSATTGLIGIPEHISEVNNDRQEPESKNPKPFVDAVNGAKTSNTTKADGYKIKSLIDARIAPNKTIVLTSDEVNEYGTHMSVEEVRHVGGSFGNDFYSESKCYYKDVQ